MSASSAAKHVENGEDRRRQVMVGELPRDFLRIDPTSQEQQIAADEQAALLLQHQLAGGSFMPANVAGRLTVTIVEAKLVKNYGMIRMDPYVRLRVGHTVYETPADLNGAKNPKWNKVFHCYLPLGVNTFYVEIYDQCEFTLDEKIAWGHFHVPEMAFKGETVDQWYPLTGRQGDEKEGNINILFSFVPLPPNSMYPQSVPMAPVVVPTPYYNVMPNMVPIYTPVLPVSGGVVAPGTTVTPAAPGQQQMGQPQMQQMGQQQMQQMGQQQMAAVQLPQTRVVVITDEDINQLQEMFPSTDKDIIKTLLENCQGNKDHAINQLLQMSSES